MLLGADPLQNIGALEKFEWVIREGVAVRALDLLVTPEAIPNPKKPEPPTTPPSANPATPPKRSPDFN